MWFLSIPLHNIINKNDDHNNSNKSVQIPIASHFCDAVKFPQVISLKLFITPIEQDLERLLFMIRDTGSLGYLSRKTSYSSFFRFIYGNESYEGEFISLSLGEESWGHRSLDTSHF